MKDLSFSSMQSGLPPLDELVWLANSKGHLWLGARVSDSGGWLWAQSIESPWIQDGKIVSHYEIEDLQVDFWAALPSLDFLNRKS
jgi:hypothetical protein